MSAAHPPIRVLLADDHTLVRAGIRALLERLPGVLVSGEAEDGRELLEMVGRQVPDVVLVDIAMPGVNGLEATTRLSREFPKVRVIILSMHQNEEYYWQARKAGAAGYLLKRAATSELQEALAAVTRGNVFVSRHLAARLKQRLSADQLSRLKTPLEQLTARQRDILRLIAEGENTKAIAFALELSPKTVEYHRAQVMTRLGIHDVPGLVRYAMRVGLITGES